MFFLTVGTIISNLNHYMLNEILTSAVLLQKLVDSLARDSYKVEMGILDRMVMLKELLTPIFLLKNLVDALARNSNKVEMRALERMVIVDEILVSVLLVDLLET